jgi:hypothetical protein
VFGTTQTEAVRLVISTVGLFVHVLLLNAVSRAENWTAYLDRKMRELEQLDSSDPNSPRVLVFSDPEFDAKRGRMFASRRIFAAIGITVMVIWIEETVRHIILFNI